MSDQINEFDRMFREKLSGQTSPPPESVWDNIEAKRTYGHVVANRVSNYWRTFGTLLLLILGGSIGFLSWGEEENSPVNQVSNTNQKQESIADFAIDPLQKTKENKAAKAQKPMVPNHAEVSLFTKEQVGLNNKTEAAEDAIHMPDAELFASLQQAAFTKPELKNDERLNAYLQQLDGWETAKPVSFVRYYNMETVAKQSLAYEPFEFKLQQPDKITYEYFDEYVHSKSFKERASIYLAFTPQSIQKFMTPEFNLSTEYLEERAKSENTRLAYTFSAALHYELNEHKFFESGVNFTQIYEEVSVSGERRFSNQYDFVEIPFLLGYKERNAKWGWHVKAGIGVQVYNNYKGYILKKIADTDEPITPAPTDGQPEYRMKNQNAVVTIITNEHRLSEKQDRRGVLDLTEEDENPYISSGVVNMHLAAGVTYHHSIRTSFLITPHYSRSLNSITKESALFKERITYMGISFGTLIKF